MEPAIWRKREGFSLRYIMRALGCSSASLVQRWEQGAADPPTTMSVAFSKLSKGEVSPADFAKVRNRWLAEQRASTTEAA